MPTPTGSASFDDDARRAMDAKMLASASPHARMPSDPVPVVYVYVQNVNMPFTAMVGLVIKFWVATAVAALVLFVCGVILRWSFMAVFGK